MQNIKRAFVGTLLFLILLWLVAEPTVFQSTTFFGVRRYVMQLTGVLAIGCMSLGMVLALRPRRPEPWFGGLDKMYRLHKWLGIAALVIGTVHWLWAKGPKWAVGWGWLERPARSARAPLDNPVAVWLSSQRGLAESLGEWAFYGAVILIALALIKKFPYRLFFKTHRLIAIAYLVLVFHTLVLLKFSYWSAPIGWVTAVLLAAGSWAALVALCRGIGDDRKVPGTITALRVFDGVNALEIETQVQGWSGHRPGQFAFATSNTSEGAHPYTIASAWHPESSRITFVVKELGDHTRTLKEQLRVGQTVQIEGPYGCFTFDDGDRPQIWIGGGIGITPFIARMKHLAHVQRDAATPAGAPIDLFHCTTQVDTDALDKLDADAKAANVTLHVLVDARDGLLTGERIRSTVPGWSEASIWFCGPAGFGEALRRDLAAHGFPVDRHFHQELFAMR
ncbi:ferredoxin reductase family protein [Lysobacter sp.]|uniref:ferredoxin reductase family protein n=1 Tax=Lysobacter sp. TaxID=72226 RepID=UPI002D47AE26|nr:ferric reductase-like transmembrane domain-containing protein [Lysobacter sp.]HZX77296.1 ferric reductase-like transmembrane domain-containing protein [Lysobacter sp.]